MAHFAQIDSDGLVVRVIVVDNQECLDATGVEFESVGAGFCARLFGGRWLQTSYTGRIRKNFAGVGYKYDPQRDAFIPPKTFPSWTLNEATCLWEPPTPYPTDGKRYAWDEAITSWVEVPNGSNA